MNGLAAGVKGCNTRKSKNDVVKLGFLDDLADERGFTSSRTSMDQRNWYSVSNCKRDSLDFWTKSIEFYSGEDNLPRSVDFGSDASNIGSVLLY